MMLYTLRQTEHYELPTIIANAFYKKQPQLKPLCFYVYIHRLQQEAYFQIR